MYEFIHNETSFVDDMNNEKDFEETELKSIKNKILLMYGNKSVCLPMGAKLYRELIDPEVIVKEGDHGFFMNYNIEVSEDLCRFLLQ